MKNNEVAFKEFINDSFKNGVFIRELRLSDHEKNNVKDMFPNAKIKEIYHDSKSEKKWYEVNINA